MFVLLVALFSAGNFPKLDMTPLAMVDVEKAALSQKDRRDVMRLVLKDAETQHCRFPVRVARPTLSLYQRVLLIAGCDGGDSGNNQRFWIAVQRASGLEVLARSDAVEQIYVLNSVTNGYRDLVLTIHEAYNWNDLRLIRYDGRHYTLERCAERLYKVGSTMPRVAVVKCSDLGVLPKALRD